MSHSRSGSWTASKSRFQTPLLLQRFNQTNTLFHVPKRGVTSDVGDEEHGVQEEPVVAGGDTAVVGFAGQGRGEA